MNASDTITAARTSLPGGSKGFLIKTTLTSGNTAVYEVPERLVRKARPDFIVADCDRSRDEVLMYGTHVATLMRHDGGYRWFFPRTKRSEDRSRFANVPKLGDLCIALGKDAGLLV